MVISTHMSLKELAKTEWNLKSGIISAWLFTEFAVPVRALSLLLFAHVACLGREKLLLVPVKVESISNCHRHASSLTFKLTFKALVTAKVLSSPWRMVL